MLQAYQLFVQEVLRLDPSGAILSYKDMMDKQVRPRLRVRLPRAMSTCHVSCPKPRHIRCRPPGSIRRAPPCLPSPHPAPISLTQIVMPAELMAEPSNPNLYDDFARVATDLNVYTGVDYAEIIEHLNEFWKIGEVTGLTPEAEEAQEHLMKLPARFNKLAQRQAKSLAKKPREPKEWAWLNGRVV